MIGRVADGRPYQQHSTGDDLFTWIKAHPLISSSTMEGYPSDHAGRRDLAAYGAPTGRSRQVAYRRGRMVFPLGSRRQHRTGDERAKPHSHARRLVSSGQMRTVRVIDLPRSARLVLSPALAERWLSASAAPRKVWAWVRSYAAREGGTIHACARLRNAYGDAEKPARCPKRRGRRRGDASRELVHPVVHAILR